MITCIIVDDEPLASQLLASYAEKIDDLNLLDTFSNPFEALTFLQKNTVDIIFLDIQMPELNGVQFAKVIGTKSSIVFTTAYPTYAVEGFELQALDYLVKPISLQRFLASFNRYKELKEQGISSGKKPKANYLFVKTEYRHQKINFEDILYLKGMGDYVLIMTTEGKVMTLENMKSFESHLPADQFIRVHKSYLISMSKIDFIEKNKIILAGERIPIGATYQEAFWKKVGG